MTLNWSSSDILKLVLILLKTHKCCSSLTGARILLTFTSLNLPNYVCFMNRFQLQSSDSLFRHSNCNGNLCLTISLFFQYWWYTLIFLIYFCPGEAWICSRHSGPTSLVPSAPKSLQSRSEAWTSQRVEGIGSSVALLLCNSLFLLEPRWRLSPNQIPTLPQVGRGGLVLLD